MTEQAHGQHLDEAVRTVTESLIGTSNHKQSTWPPSTVHS
jgi:hypothetical protein